MNTKEAMVNEENVMTGRHVMDAPAQQTPRHVHSSRYTHHEQDEVQSQHWQHQSTTLFPAPIFFRLNGKVRTYSFVVLSDDGTQDATWVQHTFTRLLQTEIPALLARVGAVTMTSVIIMTDNCGKQFKCQYIFGWIGDCEIHVAGDPGTRLHVECDYYGACHGKSISDSEGGVVKTFAKNKVMNGLWIIKDSFDLFQKLSQELTFRLREATPEERTRFEQNPKRALGDGQMLMAKEASTDASMVGTRLKDVPMAMGCIGLVDRDTREHSGHRCIPFNAQTH